VHQVEQLPRTSVNMPFKPKCGAVIQNQIWSFSKHIYLNAKCVVLSAHVL